MVSNNMAVEIRSILLVGDVPRVVSSLRAALGHEDEAWQILEARVGWFWCSRSHLTETCSATEFQPAFGGIMRQVGLQELREQVDQWVKRVDWVVCSGASGVATACYSEPDVIIVSAEKLNMDCDGICRQIRASSSAPILVISKSRTIDELCGLLLAGADCYVHQSVSPMELRARIRSLVRRSRTRISALHDPLSASRN